jgi:hypothetical protein
LQLPNSLLLIPAKGIDMKRLSIATALILVMSAPTLAQTVGLVQNSFSATYTSGDGAGCKSLLVTGQFIAATPGGARQENNSAKNAVNEMKRIL